MPWGESGTISEEVYSGLLPFFTEDDAEHIYIAKKSDCDFFLTLDHKSILNKYQRQKAGIDQVISPMKIVSPIELVSLSNA